MTRSTGQRKWHLKNVIPKDSAIKSMGEWFPANQLFYRNFRRWLMDGGYGDSTLTIYGVATRLALGYLNKPYWKIEPQVDLEQVRAYLEQRFESTATQDAYRKGLDKLAQYLQKRQTPKTARDVNWGYYVGSLPPWLAVKVREYLAFRQKNWPLERHYRSTMEILSHLTGPLRWMAAHAALSGLPDLTPNLWFDYLEARLAGKIQPATLNNELKRLQAFVQYWFSAEEPVCARMLLVDSLNEGDHIPRDAPLESLRRLLAEIQAEAGSPEAHIARLGIMDRAWFLLMLHCGLRTCEVRRLKSGDVDWENYKIRVEQSKGLKDRFVYLSQPAAEVLRAYLEVRGAIGNDRSADKQAECIFSYRHRPLGNGFCRRRLETYGERCGVKVTPHMLRHSCATLLLNAGAPVLTVQAILGHKHIDTTLNYARLYDGTIAADYHQAMATIESRLALEETETVLSTQKSLLALVDYLEERFTSEKPVEPLQALRAGILALTR